MAAKVFEIAFKLAGSVASSFASTFKQATTSLSSFSGQIDKLNREAADTDKLIKLRRETGESARAYLQAKQRVAELGRAMSATDRPTREMTAEFNRAKAASERAKTALERNRTALRNLESATGTAGQTLQTLTRRQQELARATERARKAQERQQKANAAWDKNRARLSETAGYASAAGMGLGAGMIASVKTGMEFNAQMSNVGAVSKASEEDLARLTEQAKELGRSTVWSASQAAEAMQNFAMAGYSTEQIMAVMPGTLNLASAGAVDLATASDVATSMIASFGLEASDMGRVGDVLTNTFTSTKTDLAGLGETMKVVAPTAAKMGVSLEEAAAMAGMLGQQGIAGSEAGTAMRNVMLRLANPTGEAAKYMKALGVSFADSKGKMRPIQDVLADMSKATADFSEEAKTKTMATIFGTESLGSAMILMEQAGSGALQDLTKNLGATGTTAEVAAKQTDNLKGDSAGLGSALEGLSIAVSDILTPALRDVVQYATEVIGKVQAWAKENPELTKKLVAAGAAIAAITAAALPMVAVIKTIQFTYSALSAPILLVNKLLASERVQMLLSKATMLATAAATKIWAAATKIGTVAMKGLNLAMRMNPIGLVITAIGAAIAIGVLLYKNWDTIKAKLTALWASFSERFPGIAEVLSNWWDSVKVIFEGVVKVFKGIIDFVKNVFAGEWDAAWTNVKDIFGGIWETMVGLVKMPMNNIIGMLNIVIQGINSIGSFKVPDWVPGIGGKGVNINIPTIPQLAEGGIATRSTLANIGEGREPEAVLPLSKLEGMIRPTGAGISVNFAPTINLNGGGTDAYAEVKKGLTEGRDSLKRELSRLLADERRVAYY